MTAGANVLTSRATPRRRDAPLDTIPAFGVRWLLDALERLGYDADSLAEAVGLRRRDLTDPDGVVACTIYGAIIERAQTTRFTANLGLQVAVQTPMGTYPLLDYLVLTSSDVDAGLRQLTRYFALVSNPLRIELAEDGCMNAQHAPPRAELGSRERVRLGKLLRQGRGCRVLRKII